jgi:hypothetical protein
VKTVKMILSAALVTTVVLTFCLLQYSSGITFPPGTARIGVLVADFPGSPQPIGDRFDRNFADGNSHVNESVLQALLGLGMIAFSGFSMRARRRRDS